MLMSDTDSDLKSNGQYELDDTVKPRWPIWWYLFGRPVIPVVSLVVLVISFHSRLSPYWELPSSDDIRSDDSCYRKSNGTFERRFILDVTFGSYSFAAVKVIDVIWNTLIGEGGRFLHSYILYKHIARSLLVYVMEYSSVAYQDYITMTFSQSFSGGLMFLFRLAFRKNQRTVWLCFLGMIYMLLYTILFPTIWGAATGYLSPAQRTYRMADNTYISVDSENLALCWSIDSTRLGLPANRIELGPKFSQLQPWLASARTKGTWRGFDQTHQEDNAGLSDAKAGAPVYHTQTVKLGDIAFDGWGRNIWDDIGPAGMGLGIEVSDAFQHIFEYAFTSRILQAAFNDSGLSTVGYDTEIQLPRSQESGSIELTFKSQNITTNVIHHDSLPALLEGIEYKYVNWTEKSQDDVRYIEYFNTWPMLARSAYYALNDSIVPGPGIIPYNSTIVLDNETYSLNAPFLNIGHECSHPMNYLTALGNCVCYNGVPLKNDWYREDNVVCVFSSIYKWGFSSYIVFIGLTCEVIWVVFAFWIRGYCVWRSILMRHPRVSQAGVLWSVLELSEAVKRDLHGDFALVKEGLLHQRLDECDEIGYVADRNEFGNLEAVRIVSKCTREKNLETSCTLESGEVHVERQ